MKTAEELRADVDKFNIDHPIGSTVEIYHQERGIIMHHRVMREAQLTACALFEAVNGPYDISRVK